LRCSRVPEVDRVAQRSADARASRARAIPECYGPPLTVKHIRKPGRGNPGTGRNDTSAGPNGWVITDVHPFKAVLTVFGNRRTVPISRRNDPSAISTNRNLRIIFAVIEIVQENGSSSRLFRLVPGLSRSRSLWVHFNQEPTALAWLPNKFSSGPPFRLILHWKRLALDAVQKPYYCGSRYSHVSAVLP
jgi:hypothetical protein